MLALLLALTLLPSARSFAPNVGPQESFAETFSIIADLDDGTYVQVQLAITNAGFGSQKGGCRLVVLPPGQKAFAARASVSRDEWSFTSSTNTLAVGACKLTGDNASTTVQAELDGGGVVLEIAAGAQKIVPPVSGIKIDDDTYDIDLMIPWAKASATLLLPGQEPRIIAGHAFADHSRASTIPKELARAWLRFRALGGACPALLLARVPPEGAQEGWLYTARTSAPQRLVNVSTTLPASEGRPNAFTVKDQTRTFTITPERELYRYKPAEEFGLAGRAVSAWVGNVLTITSRAQLDLGDACGKVRGLLEITYID